MAGATIQNQLQRYLVRTQMSLLNNSYKTSGNIAEKNSAANQLNTLVPQAETLNGQAQPQTPAIQPAAAAANGKKGGTEQDKQIIQELSVEFGIDGKKKGNTKDWAALAAKSDKVSVFNKEGKQVDGQVKSVQKHTLVLDSQKYGQVKIAVGGDGELNGKDDKIISIGGKTAANNIQAGLTNGINAGTQPAAQQLSLAGTPLIDQANCQICKGKGCKYCIPANGQVGAAGGQGAAGNQAIAAQQDPVINESKAILAGHNPEKLIAKAAQAQELAGNENVQKMAGTNAQAATTVGQANDVFNLNANQINNLIAALMLIVNGKNL